MQSILDVKHVSKRYGKLEAVKDVSFRLDQHEVVGLLGPNGAGKTTTIQMLLGLLEPTSGEIFILGNSIRAQRTQALQQMNFAASYSWLPGNLSVLENMYFFARLYNVPNRTERIEELLELFKLQKLRKSRTGVLSSGEQTRMGLAKAFLNKPRLLLLDEPTSSLDPDTAAQMRQEIVRQAKANNTAILWTSHNMFEMEKMCSRIIFISHGTKLAEGSPQELVKKFKQPNLEETFIALAKQHV